MAYKSYGSTSLYEIMGDAIVYRNLVPADRRIPALSALWQQVGLESAAIPRKAEPEYGRVVAEMLRRERKLDLPGGTIRRLLYIGDTQLNDGTAFRNLCAAGEWPGWAFIGCDTPEQPLRVQVDGALCLSNRWSALPEFLSFVQKRGMVLDEGMAVVLDVDKTAIGARGRNDGVINEARVEGVRRTVADLLGSSFDQAAFRAAYDELNQSPYYGLTADNQDYLAYICLMLGAGLYDLDALIARVQSGTMRQFADFIGEVQRRRAELVPSGLTSIHDDVWTCVQNGDPTPFKAFRYNEYLTTVARFGDPSGVSAEDALGQQIVITQEVRAVVNALRECGALILGVSDKPDEASVPNEAQAREGMQPLHRLPTLAVGAVK